MAFTISNYNGTTDNTTSSTNERIRFDVDQALVDFMRYEYSNGRFKKKKKGLDEIKDYLKKKIIEAMTNDADEFNRKCLKQK